MQGKNRSREMKELKEIQTIKNKRLNTPTKSALYIWQLFKVLNLDKSRGGHNPPGNELSLQLAKGIYAVGPSREESMQAERRWQGRGQWHGDTDTVTQFTWPGFSLSQEHLQGI